MGSSNDSLTPPPLLPPPPMATLAVKNSGSSGTSYNPSLLIIAGLLAFVCLASTSIHLLLRFLSRASSPSSPLINRNVSSGSTATSTSSPGSEKDPKSLIDSLPLFSLATSLTTLPKSSHNCAVCLSRFSPHDELRLLPACRHAFHSPCIDTWLRTTPSCPLCRSSIDLPPAKESDIFRVEIGSISRRRAPEQTPAPSPTAVTTPPETQSYSVGSSFEYRMEEEVEAVVARVRRRLEEEVATRTSTGPLPPGAAVAEAAGEGGKSWLKEYVDRLASSASSSFSSLRFSSRQFDGGDERSWDMEGDAGSGEGSRSTSYRWLTGAVE